MRSRTSLALVALLGLLSLATNGIAQQNRIVVSKERFTLYVISHGGDTLYVAPVCVGKHPGQKLFWGDCRTPEGTFTISSIQDASYWSHDFRDGYGKREGAYGPYFFRLSVPGNSSFGIHGTCFPETVGMAASEGCVRMKNIDLLRLRPYVFVGMKVTILPSPQDNACWRISAQMN